MELRKMLGPRSCKFDAENNVQMNRAEFIHRMVILFEKIHEEHPNPTREDIFMKVFAGFESGKLTIEPSIVYPPKMT